MFGDNPGNKNHSCNVNIALVKVKRIVIHLRDLGFENVFLDLTPKA